MTNGDKKGLQAKALRSALRAEVLEQPAPSPDEVKQALLDAGRDPDAVARQLKDLIAHKIRTANKERLTALRRQAISGQGFALRGMADRVVAALPSITLMRSRIEMLSDKPEYKQFLVAYRNGKVQSDTDLQSLYEDLVQLGAIRDDAES